MKFLYAATMASLLMVPAWGQDLQPKGVGYYGVPGARKLYQQPNVVPGPRYGTASGARQNYQPQLPGSRLKRDFTVTISSGGIPRQFIVHLPPTYNSSRPSPLIMVFHGLHMTASMMPPLTGMNSAAERNGGFIVVYPNGYQGRWSDGMQNGADDVRFVEDILQTLSQSLNIDSRRVYACGLSNGGYFSERLGCQLPNRISGIAVVAAGVVQQVCNTCTPSAIPTMFFLGTEDPLVAREGESKSLGKLGEAVGLGDLGLDSLSPSLTRLAGIGSAEDAIEFWTKHNGTGSQPNAQILPDLNTHDGCRVKREIYGGGRSEVDVYTIQGGGHCWPGGLPVAQGTLGRTTGDISASDLICAFFRSH